LADANGQYRLSYDAPVSDADMMQTFLPAFESVVVESQIRGIMCAYNSVNGVPLCANKLLQEQLRDRMGFKGIVITDCGAIGMMTGNHHWNHSDGTPYTPVEATAAAMAAGTDLNCGSAYGNDLKQAWKESRVTLSMLKQAAGRAVCLFQQRFLMPVVILCSLRNFSQIHRSFTFQVWLDGARLVRRY
jgi:beta-glucosidase-like glycosyl hydrolase